MLEAFLVSTGVVALADRLVFASVVVSPATIEIEYRGATIRVAAGSDEATLRSVLAAVRAVS